MEPSLESALRTYLPLLAPLLVLQLALQAAALIDLVRRERVRGNKWLWAAIIVLGELLGALLYFVLGRKD